jgi:hypothetical protein
MTLAVPVVEADARRRVAALTDTVSVDYDPFGMLVFARRAVSVFKTLDDLRAPELMRALDREAETRRQLSAAQNGASEVLHRAVGTLGDAYAEARRLLLKLRRALWNGRAVPSAILGRALEEIPESDRPAIARVATLIAELEVARLLVRDCYLNDRERARSVLWANARSEPFAKALLLASPELFERSRGGPLAVRAGRRERVERGLMNYLARAVGKPTPFATFGAVIATRLAPSLPTNVPFVLERGQTLLKTVTRANRLLYNAIWDRLARREQLRLRLPVRANPTLTVRDGVATFLSVENGSEVFRRIRWSDAIEHLARRLKEAPACGQDLVNVLGGDGRQGEGSQAERAYIARLFDTGFLEVISGIADDDAEWLSPLNGLLSGIDEPAAHAIHQFTAEFDAIVKRFAIGAVVDRTNAIDAARESLNAALATLEIPPWGRRDIVYEDATMTGETLVFSARALRESRVLESLAAYVRAVEPVSYVRLERATMRHFLVTTYGEAAWISVLDFYERFYRDHMKGRPSPDQVKAMDATAQRATENPFGLDIIEQLKAAHTAVWKCVVDSWRKDPMAVEVQVTRASIQAVADTLPSSDPSCQSIAAFSVLSGDGSAERPIRLVLPDGKFFLGHGKYVSRFLDLLSPDVLDDVRRRNARMETVDCEICEIAATDGFNANIHPRLTSSVIAFGEIAPSNTSHTYAITDLEIAANPIDPCGLLLRHRPTGKRLIPVDLGFLSHIHRAPLFQILKACGPVLEYMMRIPQSLDGLVPSSVSASSRDELVSYRPRIVFDGALVLARRSWRVNANALVRDVVGRDPESFYCAIRRFQIEHGLPDRVYFKVGYSWSVRSESIDGRERDDDEPALDEQIPGAIGKVEVPRQEAANISLPLEWRWSRPQYLDFTSPLLVEHLLSSYVKADSTKAILFEECLPDRRDLPGDSEGSHAYEIVCQLDGVNVGGRLSRERDVS